jgi:hypothetical protein
MIRAVLFFGLAFLSTLPSLAIAALALSRSGQPVTFDACVKYGRARPWMWLINLALFGGLWWGLAGLLASVAAS